MSLSEAYIPSFATWTGDITGPRMKIATLWFDSLYFGGPDTGAARFAVGYLAEFNRLSERAQNRLLRVWRPYRGRTSYASVYPGHLNYWTVASEKMKQATEKAILTAYGKSELGYDDYKYGIYLMHEITYWGRHARKLTYVGSDADASIVSHLTSTSDLESCSLVLKDFPDFANLSWNSVLELRESPHMKSFREKVRCHVAAGLKSPTLREEYEQTRDHLLTKLAPDVGKTTYKAIIANLPKLPVNPAGIYYGYKDVSASVELRSNYGWMFFLALALASSRPTN